MLTKDRLDELAKLNPQGDNLEKLLFSVGAGIYWEEIVELATKYFEYMEELSSETFSESDWVD